MCDAKTALTVFSVGNPIFGLMVGLPVLTAMNEADVKAGQKDVAKAAASHQRSQVTRALHVEAEQEAQKRFALARDAQKAFGRAKVQDLGDRSVRALGRAVGFELGQEVSTLERNSQRASEIAAARLTGIDFTLAAQKDQIGPTGADVTAFSAFNNILDRQLQFLQIAGSAAAFAGGLGAGGGVTASGGTTGPAFGGGGQALA